MNRAPFASALARAIRGRVGDDSFVIALYGEWGCGKTSIKNMALEELRRDEDSRPLIVEFEPWLWNDVAQLTQAFFDAIGDEMERSTPVEEDENQNKKRARTWKRYGQFFTGTGLLLKSLGMLQVAQGQPQSALELGAAATSLDEMAKAAHHAHDALETNEQEPKGLGAIRAALAQSLRELERPVLVVMDDLDRLSASEMATIFQLVKSNANFPNLIYLLLFQRDLVENSLSQVAPGAGRDFLEKIVQAGFDVPRVDEETLGQLLAEGMQKAFADAQIEIDEHEKRFHSLMPSTFAFCDSLRDVKRYCNSLRFHLDVLKDEESHTLEVNPADLAALEMLRTFEPEVYASVAGHKTELTTPRRTGSESRDPRQEEAAKTYVQALLDSVPRERRERVKNSLSALFPPIRWITQDHTNFFPHIAFDVALMTLQVFHPAIFDRYFYLAVHARDISQTEWKNFLSKTGDRHAFAAHLRDFEKRALLQVALERLTTWAERIPLEHAAQILTSLFDVGDVFPGHGIAPGFNFWGQELQARAFLQRFFFQQVKAYSSETDEEREARRAPFEEALAQALRETTGCFFPIYILSYEDRVDHKSLSERDFLFNREASQRLRDEGVRILRRAAGDGSLLALPNRMIFVYACWKDWAPDEARQWLDGVLGTGEGVVAFLRHCRHSGYQWGGDEGGPYRAVELRTVENYLPVVEAEEKIAALEEEDLSEDERDAVSLFRQAMSAWREGRLSPQQTRELPSPHSEESEVEPSSAPEEESSAG